MHTEINTGKETPEDRFRAAMLTHGLDPGDVIIADGEFHRFSTKETGRDRDGAYRLTLTPHPRGEFHCHRQGIHERWVDQALCPARDTQTVHQIREPQTDRTEEYRRAAEEADRLWGNANPDASGHPYLQRKLVNAHGVRRTRDDLLVPLRDTEGVLHSLLHIDPNGRKRFLPGGRTSGCFHCIGPLEAPTICIAEGYATAASIHESTGYTVVAAMSARNMEKVAENLFSRFPEKNYIICGDDDHLNKSNPGLLWATNAALAIGASMALPVFGKGRPDGATDFNDLMSLKGPGAVKVSIQAASTPGMSGKGEMGGLSDAVPDLSGRVQGENSPEEELSRIQRAMDEADRRLLSLGKETPEYPIDALGPLSGVCREIAREGQLPPGMVGQCLLATASLLTQHIHNVKTPGGIKPLSLNLLTIAESGEGKSTAERIALAAITHHQKKAIKIYKEELKDYKAACDARKKGDPQPEEPKKPYMIIRDATVEGIRRSLVEGVPSQALFNAEAATVLAGYGMTAENRLKTAANFNTLWDDGQISVTRSLEGRTQEYGKRLAIHWQIQPAAAMEALHDQVLSEIGMWPRFLITWVPPSPPRHWRVFEETKNEIIGSFWKRCTELLERAPPEDCDELPVIACTAEAEALLARFFEATEQASKSEDGSFRDIKPFASRGTEQVCRIAGVLATFNGKKNISELEVGWAIELVEHSLNTWKSLQGENATKSEVVMAIKLYGWLLAQPGRCSDPATISHVGPKKSRKAYHRDTALALLKQAGLIVIDGKKILANW